MSGDQKVDRRKLNRVQGSYNKIPAWAASNIDTGSGMKNRDRRSNKEIDAIKRDEPSDNRQGSAGYNKRRNHDFTYDRSVRSAARQELEEQRGPQVNTISEGGIYNLNSDGSEVPATIRFTPEFLPKDEANDLFEYLAVNLPWQQRVGQTRDGQSYNEPRLTCWFGEPYMYSHVTWHSNHDWPQELLDLRQKVYKKTGVDYNSVMCNFYRNDKDSIGWHADDEPSLGRHPNIASISLGCVRNFEMKRKEDHMRNVLTGKQYCIPLPHGSLLVMEGSVQDDWMHRVPKEYHDKPSRINLTFRVIVNSPDQHLEVSQSSRKVISRSAEDKKPAVINYQQRQLSKHCLQESGNYLSKSLWHRPNSRDGGPGPFQMRSFTSYDPWPEWMKTAGREVLLHCSARRDRKLEWSSAQCLFLQRGAEFIPWRHETGQNPVALVCLWGKREVKMRRCRSSNALGDVKTVRVPRFGHGDILLMEGNLQQHWMYAIPKEGRSNYSSCFLLLRAEFALPPMTYNYWEATQNSSIPTIHLETESEACGHVDLCERCHQALSLGQIPDCPVCRAEIRRSMDFTHP